jgi:RNA polymerase sigma factor for flagellar operon FliA
LTTARLTPEQSAWVEQAYPKVTNIARLVFRQTSNLSIEELVSAGAEGLVAAALRYDPASGVPFSAFAYYRVRGAMIDAARRANPGSRQRRRAVLALQASQALLEHADRKMPDANERDLRSLRERVAAAADIVAQTTTAVMLARMAPEDPDDVLDTSSEDAETAVHSAEVREALAEVVGSCSKEERSLIDALYFRGLSMHEYAAEIGKSVSTVSRHHAKLVAGLGEQLKARYAEP